MESKIIHQVGKCPICHSPKTVTWEATQGLRDSGKLAITARTNLEIQAIPLEATQLAGVLVETLVVHYDICAKCGMKYATWSEVVKVPSVNPRADGALPFKFK